MPLDPQIVKSGGQLALVLAGMFIPGAGAAVPALQAVLAAVDEYNKLNGKPSDYKPSHEELTAFIEEREARRIETPGER